QAPFQTAVGCRRWARSIQPAYETTIAVSATASGSYRHFKWGLGPARIKPGFRPSPLISLTLLHLCIHLSSSQTLPDLRSILLTDVHILVHIFRILKIV